MQFIRFLSTPFPAPDRARHVLLLRGGFGQHVEALRQQRRGRVGVVLVDEERQPVA